MGLGGRTRREESSRREEHPDRIVAKIDELYRLFRSVLTGIIESGRNSGHFRSDADPELDASLILATLDGILIERFMSDKLPDDPAHPVAAAQMSRFGPLLTFRLADEHAFHRFVAASELVGAATSFGGIHTTADRRARWGDRVPAGFVRLSCGIEDAEDLLADIDAALRAV